MTASLTFRTGWGEARSVPAYFGEEARSPLANEEERLVDVRGRYFAAWSAELAADPCTDERRRLARRTQRLARLARATYRRVCQLGGR